MFDYANLTNLIKEKGTTQKDLADKIGISEGQMSHKLKGDYSFKQEEIIRIAELLDIDQSEISEYFFCKRS